MKIWTPPTNISAKEIVGRRAFGSRVFATGANLPYKIDVFLDKKIGTGLSVDRLGVRKACQEVLDFLTPLCDASAKNRSSKFVGWAQISVEDVQKIGIHVKEAVGENNPFHAEICRSDYPNINALRSLAFHLCVCASKHKFICRPDENQAVDSE